MEKGGEGGRRREGEGLNKNMWEKRKSFSLEQRGKDEQGEKTKGLAFGSHSSSTLRKKASKYYYAL